MKFKVVVTEPAERDIRHKVNWYSNERADLGRRWKQGIREAIASLSENPDRCGIAYESDDFEFELREHLYGVGRKKTHRILFRVFDDEVEVLAVRHVLQQDISPDDI